MPYVDCVVMVDYLTFGNSIITKLVLYPERHAYCQKWHLLLLINSRTEFVRLLHMMQYPTSYFRLWSEWCHYNVWVSYLPSATSQILLNLFHAFISFRDYLHRASYFTFLSERFLGFSEQNMDVAIEWVPFGERWSHYF